MLEVSAHFLSHRLIGDACHQILLEEVVRLDCLQLYQFLEPEQTLLFRHEHISDCIESLDKKLTNNLLWFFLFIAFDLLSYSADLIV